MFESPTAKLDQESYRCDEARISLLTLARLTESGTNKRKMKKSRLDVSRCVPNTICRFECCFGFGRLRTNNSLRITHCPGQHRQQLLRNNDGDIADLTHSIAPEVHEDTQPRCIEKMRRMKWISPVQGDR